VPDRGAVVVIADELTAAGYRLAGIDARAADRDTAAALFAAALSRADLVILTAEMARHVPRESLESALAGDAPLVTIVPDVLQRALPPDLARDVRRALGIGA
jgi:vacuolar-type H+-ATPase subunit F/Vma7